MSIRVERKRERRSAGSARGVAIVEFTVTLPLLLLLILVTVEFGRAFMQYNTLTKAVRDGVRYLASEAILGQTGIVVIDTQLVSSARNLVVYGNVTGTGSPALPGLSGADITVVAGANPGDIVVRAAYSYDPVFFTLPMFGLGPDLNPAYTLRAGATVRAL